MNTVKDIRLVILCSLTYLQTINITVPMESNVPEDYSGLRKLCDSLLAPNPGLQYSLSLVRCWKHGAMGYRIDNIGINMFQQKLQDLARGGVRIKECRECSTVGTVFDRVQCCHLP